MNLDTGVMRTSSLSIGAWARAGVIDAPSATAIAVTSHTVRFMESSSCLRLGPGAGTFDGVAPARVPLLARGRRHRGSESPRELPSAIELRGLPDPGAHTGEIGGAHTRRLDHRGTKHV